MGSKILIIIATVWLVGVCLGATYEQNTELNTQSGQVEESNVAGYLLNISNAWNRLEVLGVELPVPMPNGNYFKALFKVVTLQFSFFLGSGSGYALYWWLVFMPFAFAGALSVILLGYGIVRGTVTWS